MAVESAPSQPVDLSSQLKHHEVTFNEVNNGQALPHPLSEDEKGIKQPMIDTNTIASAALPIKNGPVTKPPILCLGFARTGTASLAEALRILGHPNVHHGTSLGATDPMYEDLGRAADASFPVPTHIHRRTLHPCQLEPHLRQIRRRNRHSVLLRREPHRRISRRPSHLGRKGRRQMVPELEIRAKTYGRLRLKSRMILKLEAFSGLQGGTASQKFHDLYRKAKQAYVRHYKTVRESVKPELLLDFQFKDGWKPLCEFLGKEVPDVEFPRINDAASYREYIAGAEKEGFEVIKKRIMTGKKLAEQRSII
ncbi:hypothetical protein Slin15195_G115820 [Septoria linicola]|uniref:Sulfotransferase n=1 Tax=Septoria linicola TaxID=215465 RepID=A0A9Q9ER70_9PEZI|nr:hypothetical protein Slin15195_G115820 [Septoria linicola]